MRTFVTAISFLVAALGCSISSVLAQGVCYDPDHTPGKSAQSVQADMAALKAAGFPFVRTYISRFGNTDMAKVIIESGMKVALGVPYPQGDYQAQLETAVAAAQSGSVLYIFVGNENLASVGSVPGDMVGVINQIKARVPGHVKVGTVQRNTEYLDRANMGGFRQLIEACDVVGVNIHPFFHPGANPNTAVMEVLDNHYNRILNSGLPGIQGKLLLSETGWPSAGSIAGNSGSIQSAKKYYEDYLGWSQQLPGNRRFYFQAYDTPHRPEQYEKTYGLYTADGSSKYGMDAGAQTPEPTPEPTTTTPEPTTTTPEPTTPEPTEEQTAASDEDASDESSGSDGSEEQDGDLEMLSIQLDDLKQMTQVPEQAPAQQEGQNDDEIIVEEANTQSSGGGGGAFLTVVVMLAGVGAIAAALGFIYHTRMKAQELEDSERKDSIAMVTPNPHVALSMVSPRGSVAL